MYLGTAGSIVFILWLVPRLILYDATFESNSMMYMAISMPFMYMLAVCFLTCGVLFDAVCQDPSPFSSMTWRVFKAVIYTLTKRDIDVNTL